MRMEGSDNMGWPRAWPASPIATGCQGNPCSTGIPTAQMGGLRNRRGSPPGADQL